ncbi:unnamed protein product [Kluyveromyces dobzhanskii CBS 2104]|uniref:WGS project CCBQ000000000 data, contig 00102 n=1 Tax=Kluyveromyces dobzhanskii CBS 2104 TaxID=1427455 RepID=A0A0A8L6V3_9SACH|nr:unnamed protein product [Kluyveromyces dobzhanskii CBS 2104]
MPGKGSSHTDKRYSRDELKLKLNRLQEQQQHQQDVSHEKSGEFGLPFSDVLNKRDNRASLPVFAGSPAHAGVISANSGEDVNFVVGLSENLLVECRRLQSQNERKSAKLSSLQADYEKLKINLERLTTKHESMTKNEDSLKDTNWQLEMKLQSLSQDFQRLTENFNRNKIELEKQMELSRDMKTELEENTLVRMGLKSELDSKNQTHLNEIKELKGRVEELNNENDQLHNSVNDLSEKVTTLTREMEARKKDLGQNPTESATIPSGGELDFTSKPYATDTPLSSGEDSNSRGIINPNLENQTLKANLTHANQVILKLKQKLNRSKFDNTTNLSVVSKSSREKSKGPLTFFGSASTPQKSIHSSINGEFTDNESSTWSPGFSPSQSKRGDISDIDAESFISETMDYERDPISGRNLQEADDDLINKLDYEDIENFAKSHNLALVPIADLDELKQGKTDNTKSYEDASQRVISELTMLGYFNISDSNNNKEIDIKSVVENPSKDYLSSNLKKYNLTAVSEEDYQSLSNPSVETLRKTLEGKGYVALSEKAHKDLLHASENPTLSYLQNKAHELKKKLVDIGEYDSLREPDAATLKNYAKSLGLEVVDQSELTEIKDSLANPSIDYLEEKAEGQGLVVLSESSFAHLTEPNIDDIQKLADRYNHSVLHKDRYEELINPSIEKLSQMATGHQFSLISQKDLNDLKNKAERPDIDSLKAQANLNGYAIIPEKDHARLLHEKDHPSIGTIQSSVSAVDIDILLHWLAEKKSITIVDNSEYSRLSQLANSPSLERIKEIAKKSNHTVLSQTELDSIRNLAQDPPLDHLKEKLDKLGFVTITQEQLSTLNRQVESPSLETLSKKAAEKGYDVLSTSEHLALLKKSADPSIEEMQHLASVSGHLIVLQDEFDRLKKTVNEPSKNFIMQKAKEFDMVVIGQGEHQSLVHKSSDKSSILESVKNFGFIPVPVPELNSLKLGSVENVGLDKLTNRLQAFGYIAITNEEYTELKAPAKEKVTVDETIELCGKHNLKPVAFEEYQKLQEDSKAALLSEDELIKKVKSHGYVVLDKKEYEETIRKSEKPDLVHISKHLLSYKMVPVDSERYENLKAIEEAPSMEFLRKKATQQNQRIISFKEIEELKTSLEHPSQEYLENKANDLGLSVMPVETFEQLKSSYDTPTITHLSNRANAVGKRLIDPMEYDSMKRHIENPTRKEAEELASKVKCRIIPSEDYEQLQQELYSPSLEKLTQQCEKIGYHVLPKQDFDELLLITTAPSPKFLEEKALKQNKVMLSTSEHDRLRDSMVTCLQDLQQKAQAFQQVLISKSDYEALSNPSLNELQNQIIEKGHVVLDAESYETLKASNVESISKQEIIELCSKFDLLALPKEDYAELKAPSVNKIRELVESSGHVLVDREELDSLKAKVENPAEEMILATAPKYGYKLVNERKYENLQNEARILTEPTKADVEKLASKLGLVALSEESYDALVGELKMVSETSTASPGSKVAASKLYFENVIKKENSSKEVVLESGKSLGFVRLDNDEYKRLLENQQKHELTITDIYNGAKTFDLTVLPSEEYKTLLQRKISKESVTYDDLQMHASRFALKLVPVNFVRDTQEESPSQRSLDYSSVPALTSYPSTNKSTASLSSTNSTGTDYYDAQQSSNSFGLRNSPSKSSIHTSSTYYTDADDFAEIDDDNASLTSTIKDGEPTFEDLERHAQAFGYILIPKEHHVEEKDVSTPVKSEELTKDVIYSAAPRFGLSVLPNEEFKEMEKILTSERLSPENIRTNARKYGLVVLGEAEHSELVKKSSVQVTPVPLISKETVKQKAIEHGFVPVTTNEYLKLIKPDNADAIKEKASKLGIVTLSQDEYDEIKQPLNRELLEARATEMELVTLPALEYTALKKPWTVTDVKEKCEELGLVTVEKQTYEEMLNKFNDDYLDIWAKKNDKVIVSKDEYDHLLDIEDQAASGAMTKDELIERAHELNIVPIDADKFDEIQRELASSGRNSMTEDDVVLKAKELGFVPVPVSQYDPSDAREISKDDLVERSRELGLVPIPIEQFEQIKKELETPTLTREQIVERATDFNLVALDLTEYNSLKKGSYILDNDNDFDTDEEAEADEEGEEEEEETDKIDSEIKQLNKAAKRFGLLCVPESAFVATSNANFPDVANVVVLPIKYYDTLLHQESENWARITDESLQAEAKRRGFQVGVNLRKDFGDSYAYGHRKNHSLATPSVISEDTRRSMSEAAAVAAMEDMEHQTRSRAPSRSSSVMRPPPSVQTNHASLMTHSDSIATGLSLVTMASLSTPSIIPALTQTMIGEYLHKYYRRLGSLIQSSRHERYFWIHPYTLTLYWSSSNPVLENPGNNRTRAAAIMGVESVDDPYPFPAGLYQKSIIVKTEGRDIKLTCPTRQRHNIWFNSLRYLLQRNLDGINLDDMVKDENNLNSNNIYQLPGETPQTATRRLSTTRRANSSSHVMHSSSKWSLRAT